MAYTPPSTPIFLPDLLKKITRGFLWLTLAAVTIGIVLTCGYAIVRDTVHGLYSVAVGLTLLAIDLGIIVGSLIFIRRKSSLIIETARHLFCLDMLLFSGVSQKHPAYQLVKDYLSKH